MKLHFGRYRIRRRKITERFKTVKTVSDTEKQIQEKYDYSIINE